MRRLTGTKVLALFLVPPALAASALLMLDSSDDVDLAACTPNPAVRAQYAGLLGDNDLYVVPQILHQGEATLYDTAYGFLTLRGLGRAVDTTASPEEIRALLADEVSGSPVWGRWYLLAVQQTTGLPVLEAADGAELRGLITSAGSVDDRPEGSPQPSIGQRIADTAAAVDVVVAVDGGGGRDLDAVRAWLEEQAQAGSGHPYLDWLIGRTLGLLGADLPDALLDRAADWARRQLQDASPTDFDAAAHDLYGFVSLMHAADRPVPDEVYQYFRPLLDGLADQHDAQLVHYVAAAWAGRDDTPTDAVLAGLDRRRLPNGLLSPDAELVGTIDASYYVESIKAAQDQDTCEPRLARALAGVDDVAWAGLAPGEQGMWAATMKMASGDVDPDRRRSALAAMLGDLPADVTPENVRGWALEAELIQFLGGEVPVDGLTAWPAADRLGVAGAATLVNTVARLHADTAALGVRPGDLAAALGSVELTPTTAEYYDVLSAYVTLGGELSGPLAQAARQRAGSVAGCPAAPTLAREATTSMDCDLRASLSLARARQQVPTLGGQP